MIKFDFKKHVLDVVGQQHKVMNTIAGENYFELTTNKDRVIRLENTLYDECSELLNSFNWKHWKDVNGKHDLKNALTESADLLHFISTIILITKYNSSDKQAAEVIKYLELDADQLKTISNNVDDLFNNYKRNVVIGRLPAPDTLSKEDTINIVTGYITSVNEVAVYANSHYTDGTIYNILTERNNRVDNDIADNVLLFTSFKLIVETYILCDYLGIGDPDELRSAYMAKAVLNTFRVQNGYAEGTYIKIWDGQEDNEVLHSILEEDSSLTGDALLNKLEERYSSIRK